MTEMEFASYNEDRAGSSSSGPQNSRSSDNNKYTRSRSESPPMTSHASKLLDLHQEERYSNSAPNRAGFLKIVDTLDHSLEAQDLSSQFSSMEDDPDAMSSDSDEDITARPHIRVCNNKKST